MSMKNNLSKKLETAHTFNYVPQKLCYWKNFKLAPITQKEMDDLEKDPENRLKQAIEGWRRRDKQLSSQTILSGVDLYLIQKYYAEYPIFSATYRPLFAPFSYKPEHNPKYVHSYTDKKNIQTLLTDFQNKRFIDDYLPNPQKKRVVKGEKRGFSGKKYLASLLRMEKISLKDIAQSLETNYVLCRRWATESDFKNLVTDHISKFAPTLLSSIQQEIKNSIENDVLYPNLYGFIMDADLYSAELWEHIIDNYNATKKKYEQLRSKEEREYSLTVLDKAYQIIHSARMPYEKWLPFAINSYHKRISIDIDHGKSLVERTSLNKKDMPCLRQLVNDTWGFFTLVGEAKKYAIGIKL